MTIEELWQQFLYHLRVKRRSKATVRYYDVTRRTLLRFLAEHDLPSEAEQVTILHLRHFLIWLEERGLAAGGVHAHARAVRAVFNWGLKEELLVANPARRLELPSLPCERQPTVNPELVKMLVKAAKGTEQPLRDTALVLVLFDTGLRIHELLNLTTAHLLFDRGLLQVMGKGNKQRFVPIGVKAMQAVNSYLRRDWSPQHEGVRQVFLGRWGLPLTVSGASIRLAKLGAQLNLDRSQTAPHAFRRGFAVEFVRNGGDVFTLQQIMGHRSLEMTRQYVMFLDDDLKAAHLRFSPVDNL
ncbi:tyrosine-type recombinase/integrase [Deinococcus ficus]|uniref:Integrase n=1 Tax=Deinococcus ficus TaxID=317577 RepID=A0A221SXK1_9DEIO|nr:tyrosine-type recombinase/integrase [Deinococcus ficus]ASN81373.1 integrase [Deinococcus ficus]